MNNLYNLGLKCRLLNLINNFLPDRSFKVCVGSTLLDLKIQGVSQGCILSVTLFNIKSNNFVNCLNQEADGSLYVDDLFICYRSKNMHAAE